MDFLVFAIGKLSPKKGAKGATGRGVEIPRRCAQSIPVARRKLSSFTPESVSSLHRNRCPGWAGIRKLGTKHESYARARELIPALAGRKKQPLPIREAVSIPCFEFWVLLHFERSDAAFVDCAAVIQHIRARHMPAYQKGDAKTTARLLSRVEDGIAHVEWLAQRAEANDWNPYTSLHELMLHLKRVAAEDHR
jgi:RloB-like protein